MSQILVKNALLILYLLKLVQHFLFPLIDFLQGLCLHLDFRIHLTVEVLPKSHFLISY